MKVNHKTFTGGYRFKAFEGQPQGTIETLKKAVDFEGKNLTTYELLKSIGVTRFGEYQNPSSQANGDILPEQVASILINALDVEPYDLPVSIVLGNRQQRFVDGLKQIKEAFPVAQITMVLAKDATVLEAYMAVSSNLSWLNIVTVENKYPINLKELLIPTVLGKKYPVGYPETNIGSLVLSLNQVLLAGENQIEAGSILVALAGPGFKSPKVVEVAIGTPIQDLLATAGLVEGEVRLIRNSVLRGEVIDPKGTVEADLYLIAAIVEDRRRQTLFFFRHGKNVDSFTNAFLSALMPNATRTADTNIHGERRACVSCTYCQNVCPVGLIPHLLHKYVNKELYEERLAELKIHDCINCGLCDYVCPSKIHVAADIQKGKSELEKIGFGHEKYQLPGCDLLVNTKEGV